MTDQFPLTPEDISKLRRRIIPILGFAVFATAIFAHPSCSPMAHPARSTDAPTAASSHSVRETAQLCGTTQRSSQASETNEGPETALPATYNTFEMARQIVEPRALQSL